jgi:Flp pilus assembly protein TadG
MSRQHRGTASRRTDPRSRWARRRQEAGYAALLVCMLTAAVFIPVAALAVDVSRWYVEIQRVQNAADAAATAGVTYLPSDLDSAEDTAISVAARNGYPNSGSTAVKVELGSKPTQLKVTVSSRIRNSLAGYFNADFATIERSAVADYNGPAPMGSPCNTFGNEPSGALTPDVNRGPRGSVIVVPPGGATCTSTPQFWGAIAGPDTPKGNGDAYMTRTCSSGQSNCAGSTNSDFDPTGYFYMVRIGAAAVGTDVTLQIYDPAFVQVGDSCGDGPKTTTALVDNMSPYTPQDGKARYAPGSGTAFCNGDVLNGGNASDLVTSYVLRSPTDTYQPKLAPAMPECERQYPGYDYNATKSEALDSSQGSKYREDVAKVFRQWVDLCTFRPTAEGDYYLQVRTNVKIGGSSDGQGGYTNNSKVWEQTGDDTSVKGNGNNRWSLRVRGPGKAGVSIAGYDHMGVYANYSGSVQTFNLVRVVPAAATKTLKIGFFDVGDASNPGTITILGPADSNLPVNLANCTGGGAVVTGNLTGCRLTNVSSSTYNGKWQFVNVPIPSTYTCNVSATGGCWFRVTFDWTGSAPNDTTTWTARIDGDPIRLIE